MDMTNKLPIKILVVGCTPLAREVVSLVEDSGQLVGVVNLHPEVGAVKSNYDVVADFTKRRPQDVCWTRNINDATTIDWMASRKPDLIIQCGWSQIFSSKVLALPKYFCLGIHPSPLPRGRGAAVINWKIIQGGGHWGNSLFVMEDKTDTGDILDFEPFEIENRDDIRTAWLKADRTSLKMLKRTLPKIADGTFIRTKQDSQEATRYYKRTPEDGRFNIDWSGSVILRHVRALTHPYPGAYFKTKFGNIIVWKAGLGAGNQGIIPGTVLAIDKDRGLLIKVGGDDSIWMTRITPPSDVECWGDEWAKDADLQPNTLLVTKENQ